MTRNFMLFNDPAAYQITVHVNNLNQKFTIDMILENFVWMLEKPEFIPEYLDMHQVDLCGFRTAQLISHYGPETVKAFLRDVHGVRKHG